MAQSVSAERTHYFPTDRVDFKWDVANEPVITIAGAATR